MPHLLGTKSHKMRLGLAAIAAVFLSAHASAQVQQVDPSAAYEVPMTPSPAPAETGPIDSVQADLDPPADVAAPQTTAASETPTAPDANAPAAPELPTHKRDDLIGAAEGVFGKGAKGLAEIIEKILKDQGEPNAYIAGREASGAFVVGLRYGSGTLDHKVEGQRPVYWTGPSLGIDFGGDAAKTFVLIYNLFDSQDLYQRFGQVEGRAYFVGGLSATYLRRGDIVVIPIRMGVGLRLGANVGYMKFSEKAKWLPF